MSHRPCIVLSYQFLSVKSKPSFVFSIMLSLRLLLCESYKCTSVILLFRQRPSPQTFFKFEIGLCLDLSSLAKLSELLNYTNPTVNDV